MSTPPCLRPSLFAVLLAACALPACVVVDEDPTTEERLAAAAWSPVGLYVNGNLFGDPNCGGDDRLVFAADGGARLEVFAEPSDCALRGTPFDGTYRVEGDSLFIATGNTPIAAEIVVLTETELRITETQPGIVAESRFEAR